MMTEIRQGIHALSENNQGSGKPLVVAVHPYYEDEVLEGAADLFTQNPERAPRFYKDKIPYLRYRKRMIDLVRSHDGPIVTFESFTQLDETRRRFRRLGRQDDTYFIKTGYGGIRLMETDWDAAIDFLKEFQKKPWKMIGGYYHPDQKASEGRSAGCLGGVVEYLEDRQLKFGKDFEVVEGVTF